MNLAIQLFEVLFFLMALGYSVAGVLLPGKTYQPQITLIMILATVGLDILRRWKRPKMEMTGVHLTYGTERAPAISIERFALKQGWFWRWKYKGEMVDQFHTMEGKIIDRTECRARVSRFGSGGWLIEVKDPKSSRAGYNKNTYLPRPIGTEKHGKIYGPSFLAADCSLNGEEYVLYTSNITEFDSLKASLDRRIQQVKNDSKDSLTNRYLRLRGWRSEENSRNDNAESES